MFKAICWYPLNLSMIPSQPTTSANKACKFVEACLPRSKSGSKSCGSKITWKLCWVAFPEDCRAWYRFFPRLSKFSTWMNHQYREATVTYATELTSPALPKFGLLRALPNTSTATVLASLVASRSCCFNLNCKISNNSLSVKSSK